MNGVYGQSGGWGYGRGDILRDEFSGRGNPAIMGGTLVSGPTGTGLTDGGRPYQDGGGAGYVLAEPTPMPRPDWLPPVHAPPREPRGGGWLRSDYRPVVPPGTSSPLPGGAGQAATLPSWLAPRLVQAPTINVSISGQSLAPTGTTPTPAGTTPTNTGGLASAVEVIDTGSGSVQVADSPWSFRDVPSVYVWGLGYVPADQAAILEAKPEIKEKAIKGRQRGKLRKVAAVVAIVAIGWTLARASRRG